MNFTDFKEKHLDLYAGLKTHNWSDNVLSQSEYIVTDTTVQIANIAWRKTFLIKEIIN